MKIFNIILLCLLLNSCKTMMSSEYNAAICRLNQQNEKLKHLEREKKLNQKEIELLKSLIPEPDRAKEMDRDALIRIYWRLQSLKNK